MPPMPIEYFREWRAKNPTKPREYKKVFYAKNREKVKLENQKWREENPEKYREMRKNYWATHPDYKKHWREANPEKAKAIDRRAYEKAVSTPKGKLRRRMTRAVWRTLRNAKANRSWEKLVDYTVEQLKQHLEKQFTPEMNWDNYGTVWEIDHKIPVAVLNFDKPEDIDFRICWSLKNLQPLEKSANRKKQATVEKPFQPSLRIAI